VSGGGDVDHSEEETSFLNEKSEIEFTNNSKQKNKRERS